MAGKKNLAGKKLGWKKTCLEKNMAGKKLGWKKTWLTDNNFNICSLLSLLATISLVHLITSGESFQARANNPTFPNPDLSNWRRANNPKKSTINIHLGE